MHENNILYSDCVNSGLTSHQQRGHTETGHRFKVSSERPENRGIDLAIPGLVVFRVIHYTTAAPNMPYRRGHWPFSGTEESNNN